MTNAKVVLLLLFFSLAIGRNLHVLEPTGTTAVDCTPPPGYPTGFNGYIVGVSTSRNISSTLEDMFQPLYGDYLTQQTGIPFKILGVAPPLMHRLAQCGLIHFIWCGPLLHACLVLEQDAVSLVTQINRIRLPNGTFAGSTYAGGTIIVRADSNIHSLADLKGKRGSTASLVFLSGAPSLAYMRRMHVDPLLSLQGIMINGDNALVIHDVLTGKADVALAFHWELDALAEAGAINNSDFRLLGAMPTPDGLLEVVPPPLDEFTLDALSTVPEDVQTKVTVALLSLQPNHPAAQAAHILGFVPARSYRAAFTIVREVGIVRPGASTCTWSTGNRLEDHYKLITCPAGFEAVQPGEMKEQCEDVGFLCPASSVITGFTQAPLFADYTCICEPCRRIPGFLSTGEITTAVLSSVFGFFIVALTVFVAFLFARMHIIQKRSTPWLLSMKDLVLKEELGRGPNAVTYRGLYIPGGPGIGPQKSPFELRTGIQQSVAFEGEAGLPVVIRVVDIMLKKHTATATTTAAEDPVFVFASEESLMSKIYKFLVRRKSPTPSSMGQNTNNKARSRVAPGAHDREPVPGSSPKSTYYYPPGGAPAVPLSPGFGECAAADPKVQRSRQSASEIFLRDGGTPISTKSKLLLNKIEEELMAKISQMEGGQNNNARLNRTLLAWITSRASFLSTIHSSNFSSFIGCAIIPGRESTKVVIVSELHKKTLASLLADSRIRPDMRDSMAIIDSVLRSLNNLHSIYLSRPASAGAPFRGYGNVTPENVLITDTVNNASIKLSPIPFLSDAVVVVKPPGKMDDGAPCASFFKAGTSAYFSHSVPSSASGLQAPLQQVSSSGLQVPSSAGLQVPSSAGLQLQLSSSGLQAQVPFSASGQQVSTSGVQVSSSGQHASNSASLSAAIAELERYMYKAPELLLGGAPTAASDVYSFATLSYVILTRHQALPISLIDPASTTVGELSRTIVEAQLRPVYDSIIPKNVFELFQEAWSPNPERRPPLQELIFRLEKLMASPTVIKAMAADRKAADRKNAHANSAMMPAHLLVRLQRDSTVEAEHYPNASIVVLRIDDRPGAAAVAAVGSEEGSDHNAKLELRTRLFQMLENLCDLMGLFHVESVDSSHFVAVGNVHEVKVDYAARALAFANAARSAADVLQLNLQKMEQGTVPLSGVVACGALTSQVLHDRFLVTGEAYAIAQSLLRSMIKMGASRTILVAPRAHALAVEQLEGPGKLVNFRRSIASPRSQTPSPLQQLAPPPLGSPPPERKFMGQSINVRPIAVPSAAQGAALELISSLPLS